MTRDEFPVSILWAHPRSMSTAVERIMHERGDCECLHEPFMYYYYVHLGQKQMPFFDIDPVHPTGFSDITQMLLSKAIHGPVFAKDMAYYVVPEITRHPALAKRLRHIFLLRNPHRSIASYFRLDPELDIDEVGINAQWRLYNWLSNHCGLSPLVLLAEHIQSNPQRAAQQMWRYLNLPDKPDALQWQSGEVPDAWNQVSTWHQKTLETSGIQQEQLNSEAAKCAFRELADVNPKLDKYIAAHWQAYESLRQIGEQHWQQETAV